MTVRITLGAALAALVVVGPAAAQPADDPLPPGPGKAALVRVCTQCHEVEQFAYARYTPAGWDFEIQKMQSAGAEMTAEEQLAISAYLAKYLSPDSPAPTDPKPTSPPASRPE